MFKRHGDIGMETWKVLLAKALVSTWDFDRVSKGNDEAFKCLYA